MQFSCTVTEENSRHECFYACVCMYTYLDENNLRQI